MGGGGGGKFNFFKKKRGVFGRFFCFLRPAVPGVFVTKADFSIFSALYGFLQFLGKILRATCNSVISYYLCFNYI